MSPLPFHQRTRSPRATSKAFKFLLLISIFSFGLFIHTHLHLTVNDYDYFHQLGAIPMNDVGHRLEAKLQTNTHGRHPIKDDKKKHNREHKFEDREHSSVLPKPVGWKEPVDADGFALNRDDKDYSPEKTDEEGETEEDKDTEAEEAAIIKLYGPFPHYSGMLWEGKEGKNKDTWNHQCQKFLTRTEGRERERKLGVAGLFNTGTNLLSTLLNKNCQLHDAHDEGYNRHLGGGMLWQVPWGKHNPPSFRGEHYAKSAKDVDVETVMPVVMIKDPLTWLNSMCRHPYSLHSRALDGGGRNSKEGGGGCPKLLIPQDEKRNIGMRKGTMIEGTQDWEIAAKNLDEKWGRNRIIEEGEEDDGEDPLLYTAMVGYQSRNKTQYSSLLGVWNTWNRQWYDIGGYDPLKFHNKGDDPKTEDAGTPRLMIRFEDLLFRQVPVVTDICSCVGGKMKPGPFKYVDGSAKGVTGAHRNSDGRAEALKRYGSERERVKNMTPEDLKYFDEHADPKLMGAFHYAKGITEEGEDGHAGWNFEGEEDR
jgi:hypothetical protein